MTNEANLPQQIPQNDKVDLNMLWGQQDRISIDLADIKKRAKQQTRKQRWYIAVDILSFLPILIFFFVEHNLNALLKAFLMINFVGMVITVAYIIKLRWLSAFGQSKNTEDYKNSLLKQLKNNAKIARLNKHLCWIVVLAMSLILVLNTWYEASGFETFLSKGILILGVTIVLLLPWYLWARKRQIRFEREAKELETSQLSEFEADDRLR
jgi:membrane protein YdbS with pleckstrin-like domain